MTDAELGKLVGCAFGDAGFDDAILHLVREAVEGALTKVVASADAQRDGRAAGDRLAETLVARRDAEAPRESPRCRAEDAERRAAAFRAMAGVRA